LSVEEKDCILDLQEEYKDSKKGLFEVDIIQEKVFHDKMINYLTGRISTVIENIAPVGKGDL
jgi:hypothetical protein